MRIGFFTDSYLPERHGVVASMESFRNCLEALGHEVFVYAPLKPGYEDKNKVFRFKSLRLSIKPDLRLALPLLHNGRFKEFVRFKLDIVHAQSPFTLGLLGKHVAKTQNIPLVYTHHTDYAAYARIYLKDRFVSPYITRKFIATYANSADAVIAPSKKVEAMLETYGVKKPVYLVPSGINAANFTRRNQLGPMAQKLKEKMSIGPGDKILLSFGRLCSEKNTEFLVKSFKGIHEAIPSSKFIIAGSGPKMYLNKIKRLIKTLGLQNSVILAGFVSDEDKPLYYQIADLFIFASRTDTQGIVVLEAMASALPVLALADDALTDMVLDDKNGYLVREPSTEEFSNKATQILNNNELLERLSKTSLEIVQNFNELKLTNRLLGLYTKLITDRKEGDGIR